MMPGEGAAYLKNCDQFSPLRSECEKIDHIKMGIAYGMVDLWKCRNIHPLDLAALVLEDQNFHDAAKTIRTFLENGMKAPAKGA